MEKISKKNISLRLLIMGHLIILWTSLFIYALIIKNYIGAVFALFILNGIFYPFIKFILPLRKTFLNRELNTISVKYKSENIEFSFSEIKSIENKRTFGDVIIIELYRRSKLGYEFIFAPKNKNVYSELSELKAKHKNT